MKYFVLTALTVLCTVSAASAFFNDHSQVNPEVDRADSRIDGWASVVIDEARGPRDYADPASPVASFGTSTDVLGPTGSPYSLGDGGHLTVQLDIPAVDGAGVDFAVFENAFAFGSDVFGELVFVEVSSNGIDFARMPAINRINGPTGTWNAVDATAVYNLAGQYVGGTGFDLADLIRCNDALVAGGIVNLSSIRYVRLIDVIGDWSNSSSVDFFGRPVSDPYPTNFESGGADVTGVATLNGVGAVPVQATSFGALKALY